MDKWCKANCAVGFCPSDKCVQDGGPSPSQQQQAAAAAPTDASSAAPTEASASPSPLPADDEETPAANELRRVHHKQRGGYKVRAKRREERRAARRAKWEADVAEADKVPVKDELAAAVEKVKQDHKSEMGDDAEDTPQSKPKSKRAERREVKKAFAKAGLNASPEVLKEAEKMENATLNDFSWTSKGAKTYGNEVAAAEMVADARQASKQQREADGDELQHEQVKEAKAARKLHRRMKRDHDEEERREAAALTRLQLQRREIAKADMALAKADQALEKHAEAREAAADLSQKYAEQKKEHTEDALKQHEGDREAAASERLQLRKRAAAKMDVAKYRKKKHAFHRQQLAESRAAGATPMTPEELGKARMDMVRRVETALARVAEDGRPFADWGREPEKKREPEKIEEVGGDCQAFAGKEPNDDAWCSDNCGAGFCPTDKCRCDNERSEEMKKDSANAVSGDLTMEDAIKVERVKVDMESKGDVNFPFDKAIIGYWGAGPYTPFEDEEGPSVADALKEGYNVITVSFADTFTTDGHFEVHTDMCPSNADRRSKLKAEADFCHPENKPANQICKHHHICALPKWNISQEAGISSDSWRYILSFGGAAGPGPYMPVAENLRQRVIQEDQFADGFIKTYHQVKEQYGFDGIDIDVESSLTTPLLAAFRKIFKILHSEGEIISMAPESPSLNPQELKIFQEGSLNSYVPLADSTIINHVTFVAPQLYNDAVPFEDPVKYVKSLQNGQTIEWDGKRIEIKVPSSKIVLGHPATEAAAPATRPLPWQNSTERLLSLYVNSPELMDTKGVMTWSVGHDWSNNWKWVRTIKKIWGHGKS